MADAPFLHIRSPDPGRPPQVLTLDRPSLRLGHGPRCDLALPDPALAEVHCILRRRGDDWTVQPIGPPGLLSLDGRPVETTLRLPPGATLRLGRFALRLVDPRPAARFGTYPTPPAVAPEPDNPTDAPPLDPAPLAGAVRRPSAPAATAPEREPPARWQPPRVDRPDLARREDRLREWTARWEAVGRDLRARAAARPGPRPAAPPPAATPEPPPSPPMPPAARVRLALPAPTMPDVEPEAEAPVVLPLPRRHEDPAPPETVVVPALPVEPEPERQDSIDFASTLATEVPDSLIAGRLESLPEAAAEEPPAETSATEAASIQSPPVEPVTVDDLPPTEAEAAPAAEPLPASEPAEPAAEIAPPVAVAKVAERPTDPEPEPVVAPSATYLVATDFELESATWRELSAALTPPAEPVATVRDEPPPPPVVAVPVEVPPAPPQPEEAPRPIAPPTPAAPEPPTVPTPLAGVSEWPSAKVILEQYRRDRPTPAEAPPVTTARPPRPLPQPTVEYAPRGRTVSGPVGVGIAAALALVLGSGTMALSWAWAQDDRLAGVVADQLVRADGAPRRVGIPEEAPARSWWRSTADHLYLHALARAVGAPNDPARAEEARALLDAARSAAPLQRQVRLVLAAGDAPAVGLSRDPLALRLAGRRLLREGKVEPALGVYREALDLLDRIDLAAAPVPPFVEAPEVRRFALPGEAVLAPILEDLAAAAIPPEARARWLDGLPRRAILGLALFRFHQGRGEASEAGHAAALAQAAEPPASPAARALHHAALAELLALSGRPQEAADRYREAVAALPEGTIRRTWALNLGELEARLGHEDEVRSAWALARGDDPDDAVNLRLVDARRRRGQLVEPPALLATPTPPPGRRDEGVRPADFRVPPGGPHGRPWAEPR